MATFSVIVSGDRDSNSTHAACVLVEARNCSDSCFCFRCLKVGAEHSQLSAHGWSRSSERKEQVFGFHGLSDAPNTHFVHSVADFNNLLGVGEGPGGGGGVSKVSNLTWGGGG